MPLLVLLLGCGGGSPITFVDVIVQGDGGAHVTGADRAPDTDGDSPGDDASSGPADSSADQADSGAATVDTKPDSGTASCGSGTSICCQPSGVCGCYAASLCDCYAHVAGCWPADASNPNAPAATPTGTSMPEASAPPAPDYPPAPAGAECMSGVITQGGGASPHFTAGDTKSGCSLGDVEFPTCSSYPCADDVNGICIFYWRC